MWERRSHCSILFSSTSGKLDTLDTNGRVYEGNITNKATVTNHVTFSSITGSSTYRVRGTVNDCPVTFIVDTGAAFTLLRADSWRKINSTGVPLDSWNGPKLVSVNGTSLCVLGQKTLSLRIGEKIFDTRMIITDSMTTDSILGMDFLESHSCLVDLGSKTLHFPLDNIETLLEPLDIPDQHPIGVCLIDTVKIPPLSEIEVPLKPCTDIGSEEWLLEPDVMHKQPASVARSIVCSHSGVVYSRLLNTRGEPVVIYKGTRIAKLEKLNYSNISSVSETSSKHQKTKNLKKLVNDSGDTLNDLQREQLYNLLIQYEDVFATDKSDLGRTAGVTHSIDTGSSKPIRQPVRRLPLSKREEASDLLHEMLDQDIIQPSRSPWAAPIVLVKKKNGTTRFCIDYRKLNSATSKDAYPIPRIDETLDTLAGSKWFSTLDMIGGYWQVSMDPIDREKTAFCTAEEPAI